MHIWFLWWHSNTLMMLRKLFNFHFHFYISSSVFKCFQLALCSQLFFNLLVSTKICISLRLNLLLQSQVKPFGNKAIKISQKAELPEQHLSQAKVPQSLQPEGINSLKLCVWQIWASPVGFRRVGALKMGVLNRPGFWRLFERQPLPKWVLFTDRQAASNDLLDVMILTR